MKENSSQLNRSTFLAMSLTLEILAITSAMAQQRADEPQERSEPTEVRVTATEFNRSLEALVAGKGKVEDVIFWANWGLKAGGSQRAIVYGDGIGLWSEIPPTIGRKFTETGQDPTRQFKLTQEQVLAILKRIHETGVPFMPQYIGEQPQLDPRIDPRDGFIHGKDVVSYPALTGPAWIGGVSVTINGFPKGVTQVARGEQSERLELLAREILAICEPLGRKGITAESISDGLQKIVEGKLSPRWLNISGGRTAGYLDLPLTKDDWHVTLERGNSVIANRKELHLTDEEMRGFAKLLLENDIEVLQGYFRSAQKKEIHIYLLDYKMSNYGLSSHTGEPFTWIAGNGAYPARKDVLTANEKVQRAERIYESLHQLWQRAQKEGKPQKKFFVSDK